jgi:hypothetical protein
MLAFQEIGILWMLVDIGFDERALRDDFQPFSSNLIQRALDQYRADTFTAQLFWDFGVDEGDDTIGDFVVGRREITIDQEFIAVLRRVVDYLGHEISLSLFCLWLADLSAQIIKPNQPRPLFKDYPMRLILSLLGVVLLVAAAVYFLMPADQLPSFMPGHEAGVTRVHAKHGIVAGVAGVVLLAAGWWTGRR